ncbi:zinc finger protein 16-like [Aphidius gifuensis]|uniref:zinc finger protein 16-like n=1 Tax=Aphidius gifuensis TaxID=684658 RepID=UPI001CDC2F7A|nr:zinc finger protein 16-like [Aphidius gifuensis]
MIKRNNKSFGTQTIEKVDASTMTDPLSIDIKLTSEYLARCENYHNKYNSQVQLPTMSFIKYDDEHSSSETSSLSHSSHDIKPKIEYDIEPTTRHVNDCSYSFEEHHGLLDDDKQRPYICDICGASLKRKEHLDRHKQGHNKDRPYQCSMCSKAFKRNEHLARHMIIHSGSKNQICTQCGKAFYRKDHLKKHLQSHNGNRANKTNVNTRQHNDNIQNDDINSAQVFGNFAMMMRQAGLRT